jgi:hypothetical protein
MLLSKGLDGGQLFRAGVVCGDSDGTVTAQGDLSNLFGVAEHTPTAWGNRGETCIEHVASFLVLGGDTSSQECPALSIPKMLLSD